MAENGFGARIFGWLDRVGSLWSVVSTVGTISVGGLTAWAAAATNWLDKYAPFSWVAAGILGALFTVLIFVCASYARFKWVHASAVNKWKEAVSTINPLEDTFRNQRIKLSDLVSPGRPEIIGKTFIDCELVGPANLGITATSPGAGGFSGVTFFECDWIVIKERVPVRNAILLRDCTFVRGTIFYATFLLPPGTAQHVLQAMGPGIPWLTELPRPNRPASDSSHQSP